MSVKYMSLISSQLGEIRSKCGGSPMQKKYLKTRKVQPFREPFATRARPIDRGERKVGLEF